MKDKRGRIRKIHAQCLREDCHGKAATLSFPSTCWWVSGQVGQSQQFLTQVGAKQMHAHKNGLTTVTTTTFRELLPHFCLPDLTKIPLLANTHLKPFRGGDSGK